MKIIFYPGPRLRNAREFPCQHRTNPGLIGIRKQKRANCDGRNIGTTLQRQELDVDTKALTAGITDGFAGKPALTEDEQKARVNGICKRSVCQGGKTKCRR